MCYDDTCPFQIVRTKREACDYVFSLVNTRTNELISVVEWHSPFAPVFLRKRQARLNTASFFHHQQVA